MTMTHNDNLATHKIRLHQYPMECQRPHQEGNG